MRLRGFIFLAIFSTVLLAVPLASGQTLTQPWGDPNIEGVWDFRTITPLERPQELADKSVLTAEEAAVFAEQTIESRDVDNRPESASADVDGAYNSFWWDWGDSLTDDRRTSLVVDPPSGRIPRKMNTGLRSLFGSDTPAGPEDRPLWERCIIGFNSGPPMLPSAYNNNVQFFQTPDHVVILNEMVHNARIVPLDHRPHLDNRIRQQVGDSRGYWEGETLVVETTNFLRETGFTGSGSNLKLEERFTRVDENTMIYEFTLDDPDAFEHPWTAMIPMRSNTEPMFEYACHEGNYGMTNLLSGARVDDKVSASSSSGISE